MINDVLKLFNQTFGANATICSQAPGRLEILGNHTDYNEGFVLSTAVDCYTFIAIKEIPGDTCKVISPEIEKEIRTFSLNQIADHAESQDWLNYIKGTVKEFQKRGMQVPAFEAAILSTVPLSAGMSSSASLEIALLQRLHEVLDLEKDINEMARIGQGCENNFIGANTGLMDQFSSLAGQKDSFVLSEYRNLTVKAVPVPKNISLVVFNSGVKHDLSQEYNERRLQCEESVKILKQFYPDIQSLRDINLQQLEAQIINFPEEVYRRALHVVGENDRVHKALNCLEQKDVEGFAELLFDSHKSSIDNFENSCQELDFLVNIAQSSSLCYGARISGGGFGGISIHLVESHRAEDYQQFVQSTFKNHYGFTPDSFICQSAQGAYSEKLVELV
ncbi:MAG: galactokinase [Lentisphaerales bacterium]|nr:galactokinase [Lentisphaerales bacterium]